jgi:putative hemolysin
LIDLPAIVGTCGPLYEDSVRGLGRGDSAKQDASERTEVRVAGLEWLVMLAMIALNSVFAAYEIAVASVGRGTLSVLARQKRRGALAALRMKTSVESSLAVIQLGITLVGIIAAAIGGKGAEKSIEPLLRDQGFSGLAAEFIAVAIVVLPLTLLTIVFGELLPKVFALRNKEWICLTLSPAIEWFSTTVWPIVWLLERSVTLIIRLGERHAKQKTSTEQRADEATLQELRAVASLARTSRLIGIREESIIVNAARLSTTTLSAIMLPAQFISMLNIDDSPANALVAGHHDMHTRFPVTERPNDPRAIVGYVNFKDIVAAMKMSPVEPDLRGILRPIPRLREDLTVATSLEKLTHERVHIALVTDAQDQVAGMLTLEDILEELIGEIHDEYDRLPSHITSAGKAWIIGGSASLERVRQLTGLDLTSDDITPRPVNVNDWVIARLGHPVRGGEMVQGNGVRAVVRKVRRQNVLEALISKA